MLSLYPADLIPNKSFMRILLPAIFSALTAGEPIVLPLAEGLVSVSLDGQTLNFEADSGSARSYAFYGPSYEETFGRGSCDKSLYGCYFCPPEKPCDDLLSRRRFRAIYGSGTIYNYVEHTVTIDIGNHTLENFSFGLVLEFSNIGRRPMALLGLSLGRDNLPDTILEQLKKRGVIENLSYSIHVSEKGPGISGRLTLDDSATNNGFYIPFSRQKVYGKAKTSVMMGPLGLLDSRGMQLKERRRDGERNAIIVDSGTSTVKLSDRDFEKLIDVTWTAMCRSRAERIVKKKAQLVTEHNFVRWVRREAVAYLPTLSYEVGQPPHTIDIRIEPRHYSHSCNTMWCVIDVASWAPVIGYPLFRAYDVNFDLTNKRMSFSNAAKTASIPAAASEPGDIQESI